MASVRERALGLERIGIERIDVAAVLERRRLAESVCQAELACRHTDPALAGPLFEACLTD